MQIFKPKATERLVARAFHLYPLLSGCGAVANSKLAKKLVPDDPRAVWGNVRGRPCLVPLNDLVGRAIFLVGELDRKVTWVLERCLEPGDTVLDVGANLGLVTLQAADIVGPKGKVHTFEPSPSILEFLERTIQRNAELPIALHCFALGDQPGTLSLRVPKGNAGRASFVVDAFADYVAEHEVQVRLLGEVLVALDLQEISVMKIDVEGFEAQVLKGLFGYESAPVPRTVLFEEHNALASETVDILKRAGYDIFGMPKTSYLSMTLASDTDPTFAGCHDFVALRREGTEAIRRRLGVQ